MRRKGISAIPGIFVLIAIAIVIALFIVPIFGSIEQVESNEYDEEFTGVSGIVDVLYKISPVGIAALALLTLMIAVIFFTRSGISW